MSPKTVFIALLFTVASPALGEVFQLEGFYSSSSKPANLAGDGNLVQTDSSNGAVVSGKSFFNKWAKVTCDHIDVQEETTTVKMCNFITVSDMCTVS